MKKQDNAKNKQARIETLSGETGLAKKQPVA